MDALKTQNLKVSGMYIVGRRERKDVFWGHYADRDPSIQIEVKRL